VRFGNVGVVDDGEGHGRRPCNGRALADDSFVSYISNTSPRERSPFVFAKTDLQVPQLEGDQLNQVARAHRELATVLAGRKKASIRFVVDGCGGVAVPRAVFELFVAALEVLAEGEAVTLIPSE